MHCNFHGRPPHRRRVGLLISAIALAGLYPAFAGGHMLEKLPIAATQNAAHGTRVGLGLVVSPEGHILTSNHVVAGCSSVRFARSMDNPDLASVIARDENNDLALLKTIRRDLPAATLRVYPPADEGQFVQYAAAGADRTGIPVPFPLARGLTLSTFGPHEDARLFAFSGRLIGETREARPGDSGGPVLDEHGNVIGILTGLAPYGKRVGVGALRGVGFVLHSSVAALFLRAHEVPLRATSGAGAGPDALMAGVLDRIAPAAGGDPPDEGTPTAAQVTVRIWCTQP